MKIAIDLRPLQIGHQNRGIGAYLLNILEYFPKDPSVEYIFIRYSDTNPIAEFNISDGRNYSEIVQKKYDFKPNPKQTLLFIFGLVRPKYLGLFKHRPDVFFQPDYLLGIPSKLYVKKTVVVCYDLIPLKFKAMYIPSWHRFAGMRHLRLRSRVRQSIRALYYSHKYSKGLKTFRRADSILSISDTTTSDLVSITKVDKDRVSTIYLAPSYRDTKISTKEQLPAELKDVRYIFYIGGGDKRRQITYLISTFNKLNGRGHKFDLVLAGNEFTIDSKETSADVRSALKKSSYSDRIHLLGAVSEPLKLTLMQHATVFVYPSLYEGFGMPVVEAMLAGTPVVTYRNSSIAEIGQDNVLYAHESSDGIYDSILELQKLDADALKIMTSNAIVEAGRFNWQLTGDQTWSAIKNVTGV